MAQSMSSNHPCLNPPALLLCAVHANGDLGFHVIKPAVIVVYDALKPPDRLVKIADFQLQGRDEHCGVERHNS
jgi:hypothetical protein